jgi:hypothetical protein
MAAANGFEWALQANYQLPDFDLTHEERRAVGEIAEFGLIFGAGTVAKVTKVSQKFVVAAKIFQQTAAACDDIAQIGRALKSFREAGQVLAGKTDIQTSIRNILDNYCFVGTVDVMTYDTGNKLMGIAVTPTVPLIETSFGVPRDVAAGWIIIGAGAMALLPVFSGRRANRHAEEHAQADSDWVWA